MNTGRMPNTDFMYEEFEGLLASFYLTLKPLLISRSTLDQGEARMAIAVLDGFADRHGVRRTEAAAGQPSTTLYAWGQPRVFSDCRMLIDMLGSFWRDFGVGSTAGIDGDERIKLGRILLALLARKNVLVPQIDGATVVGVSYWLDGQATVEDLVQSST